MKIKRRCFKTIKKIDKKSSEERRSDLLKTSVLSKKKKNKEAISNLLNKTAKSS